MRVPTLARISMAVIGLVVLVLVAALVAGMVPEGWRWKPALAAALLLGLATDLLVAAWRANWPVTAIGILGVH